MKNRTIKAMRNFTKKLENKNKNGVKKIGILFSGGRDSSILAASLCHISEIEIHLIIIKNGVSHGMENILYQTKKIKDMGKMNNIEVFIKVIDIVEQFQINVMRKIESDFTKRRFSSLLACLGCKYLMHLNALIYAKNTELSAVVDGYSIRQQNFPEQTYDFIKRIELLYFSNGLLSCSPLYNILDTRENIITILTNFGLKKSEGTCMFAHSFSIAKSSEITEYLNALERRLEINT